MPDKTKVALICLECEEPFYVIPFFAKPGPKQRKFCQQSHANRYAGRRRAEAHAARPPEPKPVADAADSEALFPCRAIIHINDEHREWCERWGDDVDLKWTRAHVIRMALNRLMDTIDEAPLTVEEIDRAFGGRYYSDKRGRQKEVA